MEIKKAGETSLFLYCPYAYYEHPIEFPQLRHL